MPADTERPEVDPDTVLPSGVTDKPKDVLVALAQYCDGRAAISELGETVPFSVKYHLRETLEPAGLVAVVGEEQRGGGDPATVWALTPSGEVCAEAWADESSMTVAERDEQLRELRERVAELEEEQEKIRPAMRTLVEESREGREELGDRIDALSSRVDTAFEHIRGS